MLMKPVPPSSGVRAKPNAGNGVEQDPRARLHATIERIWTDPITAKRTKVPSFSMSEAWFQHKQSQQTQTTTTNKQTRTFWTRTINLPECSQYHTTHNANKCLFLGQKWKKPRLSCRKRSTTTTYFFNRFGFDYWFWFLISTSIWAVPVQWAQPAAGWRWGWLGWDKFVPPGRIWISFWSVVLVSSKQ